MDPLDELSQKKLDSIVIKEIAALTVNEILFLKARQSYLNETQKEFYAEVLKSKVEVETSEVPVLQTDNDKLSYRELQRKARSLGLQYVGVSRDDLLLQIAGIEGPEAAGHPE